MQNCSNSEDENEEAGAANVNNLQIMLEENCETIVSKDLYLSTIK